MVDTAKLTELFVIKELTVSATTYGEAIEIFKPVQTVYGSILNQRGNTNFTQLPGSTYTDSLSIYLRYLPITDKKNYRITYGCDDYEITSITTVQRNKATIIEMIAVN